MQLPDDLDRLAREHLEVLKAEAATVVERLGAGADAVVRKVYRNRGSRWFQTFVRRSRAEREYHNLRAVEATGVRCTTAIAWSARRRFGFVDESTLVTRFLPDARTLKQVLADLSPSEAWRTRAALAAAMGRLVARMHRGGFLWATPMPRNVLVLGDPAAAELAVCDTPAGIRAPRSVHGGRLATIDVFAAAFSPSRRRDFSAAERMRWLLGYTNGDRAAAKRLWHTLARRPVVVHDALRALAATWYTYLGSPLRRPHRPRAEHP
ncbi:MAG: hypothetical protein JNK78_07045 [Planctomycetes bacterium]|nr:hypothetical protein [Planctomycetota bacterium]